MAKSLFASLLHHKPKKAVAFEAKNGALLKGEPGNILEDFHDFHRAFSSQNNYKFNIGLDIF